MREYVFSEERIQAECGGILTLRYTVLAEEMTVDGSSCTFESYGIRITVPETGESEEFRGITVFSGELTALLLRLTDNTVTPCTLHDVVCDYLSAARGI